MLKYFRPKIRSRHPSHAILRKKFSFPLYPFKSVIRLGSYTELTDTVSVGGERIELNTVDSINNSADKLAMKQCFTDSNVITADWFICRETLFYPSGKDVEGIKVDDLKYPIIAKHRLGSKGRGNYKLDSSSQLKEWLSSRMERLDDYIFERFYNYVREYRLHVTEEGCFYTCRKMLKSDTPEKDKWYRNDDHCVWIKDDNPLFDKPKSWNKIVRHSVKALKSTGLDFGAVDVKVQSATTKDGNPRLEQKFIIIEINSAPSFGEITQKKYLEVLPQLLFKKNKKIKQKNEKQKEVNVVG